MTTDTPTPDDATLAERIRSEAAIADRPGQMERLETIALEFERLGNLLNLATASEPGWRAEADDAPHATTERTGR